jgi:hypothetical protein
MDDHVEVANFTALARQYVELLGSDEAVAADRVISSLAALLPALYIAALRLPDVPGSDEEIEGVTHQDWKTVYNRVNRVVSTAASLQDWALSLGPDNNETRGGWLADDLADIWRDLENGLMFVDAGSETDAVWEWRFSFWNHWGQHTVGALHVIHSLWGESRTGWTYEYEGV